VLDHITPHRGSKELFWGRIIGKHYVNDAMIGRR